MVTYDARPSSFTQMTTTSEWEYLMSIIGPAAAIDAAQGNAMNPTLDTGGRNAVIDTGNILIKGQLWRCDAPVSMPIPAASAQNRIDRLVLRLTRGASTSATVVQPAVITGTPSGSPNAPALTQTPTGIWEYPVCRWTATSAGALTGLIDDRRLANDSWHDTRPLQNSFVGTISGYPPLQYRFANDAYSVEVAGFVQSPGTVGNYNGTTICTLPQAYRPNLAQAIKIPATQAPDGAASPTFMVQSNGQACLNYLPPSLAGQTVIGINGRYPLDDQYGFIAS